MSKTSQNGALSVSSETMSIEAACAEAGKFGQMVRALGRLQEVAATLANAGQVIRERTQEGERIATENTAARAALDKAKQLVEETLQQAQALRDQAHQDAEQIRAEASAAKEASNEEALRAAKALTDAARTELASLQAQVAEAAGTLTAKRAELSELLTAIEAARAHQSTGAALDKARANVK